MSFTSHQYIYIYTLYVIIWYPYQTTQADATLSMAETLNQLNGTLSHIIPYFSHMYKSHHKKPSNITSLVSYYIT